MVVQFHIYMNSEEHSMKFRISSFIIINIIVFFYSTKISSQEQDPIIRKLDSQERHERVLALGYIDEKKLVQYAGALEERIFLQGDAFLTYSFLQTLEYLNSPNLYTIAQKFLDTIDYYPNVQKEIYDLLEAKVTATGILIKFNDYSTINYVWELIDRDKPQNKFKPVLLGVLGNLLYVPAYENRARDEFLGYFNNNYFQNMEDGLYNFRPIILGILTKRYGLGIKDLLINSFLYDPAGSIQAASLQYLLELNYSGIDSLLIDRLYINKSDSTIRPMAALTISTRLSTPQRYYILKNYRPPIQNEHRTQGIATYIATVKPKPPKTENLIQHIDTTIAFVNDLLNYTWLGNIDFSNELKNILSTAKTNLQNGDSLACRVQVKAFQELVDSVYIDSLNADSRFVTIEGMKFLYWNAQYILDRLPEPPIVVNADIDVINPAMSLVNPGLFTMEIKGTGFTTNSVVYFNGNARATTFVADTLLTTEIQSTDVSAAGNYPVWVTDGTINSDTLTFSVVSTLPKPVRPVLECVRNNGDGTYTAYFGYKNENDVSVYIPVGNKNKFTPTPQDRGQTKVFLPGRKYKVFTVNFNGSNLVWTLNGRTSTASSNSAPCN